MLVVIAAGLLATALHTAHEAAWFNGFQGQALDLSWLVVPGTVTSSLLTGMLGLQPEPTYGEVAVWLDLRRSDAPLRAVATGPRARCCPDPGPVSSTTEVS